MRLVDVDMIEPHEQLEAPKVEVPAPEPPKPQEKPESKPQAAPQSDIAAAFFGNQ